MTLLTDPVGAGAHRLPVECESQFAVDETVRIVGDNNSSECGTIVNLNFSSIWLGVALQNAYRAGSSVIRVPASEELFESVVSVFATNEDLVSTGKAAAAAVQSAIKG